MNPGNVTQIELTPADSLRVDQISSEIIGYSGALHYGFFKWLLANQGIKSLLILGVYHGRDIAFMLDILTRYHLGRKFAITGVDKFEDAACADWPEEKRGLDWKAAGFGEAPTLEKARANLLERAGDIPVYLNRADDAEWLKTETRRFDAVYLDTAHDYATVKRQLAQIPRVCHENTLLCGDDFSNDGTWGVKRAVEESFSEYTIWGDWIWSSEFKYLKKA